jgi:hypothetical protein
MELSERFGAPLARPMEHGAENAEAKAPSSIFLEIVFMKRKNTTID